MNTEQFEQYKKTLAEIQKLKEMCDTKFLDTMNNMLTRKQYTEVKTHPAFDVLYI